jgi:Ca2+-binding EF-hand superfamily protein
MLNYIEEKIINENLLTKQHIDEIYNIFVHFCEDDKYVFSPKIFANIFQNISEKRGLKVDKDIWNQIFYQIDFDKDGSVSFQDFLKFIDLNLKLIFAEAGEKLSVNKIK